MVDAGAGLSDRQGITPVDTSELLEKYDAESRYRRLTGFWAAVVSAIAIGMSAFHLYTSGFGALMAMKQRGIHLAFLLALVFLLYPASRKSSRTRPTPIDMMWLVAGVASTLYVVFTFEAFSRRGGVANIWDYTFGVIAIVCVLEAARRVEGNQLPLLALVFWMYGIFGDRLPGILGHTGFSFKRIVYHLYLSSEGIFGVALGVSATYIFLFILFGAFLGETGMAELINKASLAVAGRSPGGPAKVAVVASGLLGMINGSAVANVCTTGAFTIPLMKSVGYRPVFAGAVEAVASTGGQIMPPIMGAAAFVMAEFLGVSYAKIMIAAILPALLYYLACYTMIHLEAVKTGLKGLSPEQLPSLREVLRTRGHLVLPLIVIVYLLVSGKTPLFSAFWGIVATVVSSWLRKDTRLSLRGFLRALENGARSSVGVGIACAVVGNIIGITSLTGLGLTLGDNIVSLAGGSMMLTLALTMVVSIILGMGLPTTACYIVAAATCAPALIKLKVPALAAHMFVFYFACLSNLTPPVALAAYTGAGIAGANPSQVGWTAFRLSVAGFIVPYIFVTSPVLLLSGGTMGEFALAAVTGVIGTIALGAAVQGHYAGPLNVVQRAVLMAGSLALLVPGISTDLLGLAALVGIYLWQRLVKKTEPLGV